MHPLPTRTSNALEILIADDDESTSERLEALLAAQGLQALSVSSLELAREAMRAVHFPVVILDRNLGDGDGADLCREYRARQTDRRVRILMLSSQDSAEEVQFALEAGADEFVSKQSGDAAIVERICRLHAIACQRLSPDVSTDAEAARLRALAECAILDTGAETAFEDITLIASTLFKTPIAAISLIDANRQWFKAKVGIEVEETPLEDAFCVHVIQHPKDVLVVADARLDARFADNPMVTTAPQIRFYAGAPIVTSDGFALGTVCVIDTQPRELTNDERLALQALARQVVTLLEQRRASKEFEHSINVQRTTEAELRRREALLRDAYENARDELCTSVATLRDSLASLSSRVGAELSPEAKALFDLSVNSADHLQRLIDDMPG
ncbi:MAG: response regulator [Steroidobacteraceae bacterium]